MQMQMRLCVFSKAEMRSARRGSWFGVELEREKRWLVGWVESGRGGPVDRSRLCRIGMLDVRKLICDKPSVDHKVGTDYAVLSLCCCCCYCCCCMYVLSLLPSLLLGRHS